MATDDSSSGPILGEKTGKFPIRIEGEVHTFHYPERPHLRDMSVEIMEGKTYPLPGLADFTPSLIVDIGAGIGAAAFYFHGRFPDARIHCYEPLPENYSYLERNVAPFPNVTPHACGLYDREAEAEIYAGKVHPYQSSIIKSAETGAASQKIKLERTADEFRRIGAGNISILKVDTEGCEVPIVSDALEAAHNIDLLYVEYHAEDDRLALDRILSPRFLLGYSKALKPHRGECAYVSKTLASRYPGTAMYELTRPEM